ncbi:MAG: TraC family protein, partial [Saezia sp.]
MAEPGEALRAEGARSATLADEQKLYTQEPSFADLLPWVEYLPKSQAMLLDDGESVAAFFELLPVGTEGRQASWLRT